MSSEDQYIQKRIKKYWLEQLKQYKFTKSWPTEFGDIIESLRKERCLEYLSDKEMESRFSSFASNLIIEVNQGKEIDKRIDDFISSIVKPLDELEFLFPIPPQQNHKKLDMWQFVSEFSVFLQQKDQIVAKFYHSWFSAIRFCFFG